MPRGVRLRLGRGLGIGAEQKTVALAFAEQRLVPNGAQLLELLEVNPDVGAALQALALNQSATAALWCPITPASAQAARSVEDVMSRIGQPLGHRPLGARDARDARWRAEWKYDGERLQIHAAGSRVQLFSSGWQQFSLVSCGLRKPQGRHSTLPAGLGGARLPLQERDPRRGGGGRGRRSSTAPEADPSAQDRILPFQILARRPRKASQADAAGPLPGP